MSVPASNHFENDDGSIRVDVVERSSIHIRAISKFGDPVELNEEECIKLIRFLTSAIDEIR